MTTPPAKKKNYRKKKPGEHDFVTVESPPTSGQEDSTLQQKLLQTKELQKLRARSKGVNAGVGAELSTLPSSEIIESTQRSLDETFTTQSDGPEVNTHMEKYIEEQLAKKKIQKSSKEELETTDTNVADLYTTPEHLKTIPQRRTEESSWLTGIVEVQLPIEYKIKNIEETERAKREMMQSKNSFGSEARSKHGESPYPRFITQFGKDNKKGNQRASDDVVMERFKKRFRH